MDSEWTQRRGAIIRFYVDTLTSAVPATPAVRRNRECVSVINTDIVSKQTLLLYCTVSYLVDPTRPSEMQENAPRSSPVIVITGTPGTGKTTHAQLLMEQSPVPLQHINVSELIKERTLHDGFDEEWQTYIVDEDKVCSYYCYNQAQE